MARLLCDQSCGRKSAENNRHLVSGAANFSGDAAKRVEVLARYKPQRTSREAMTKSTAHRCRVLMRACGRPSGHGVWSGAIELLYQLLGQINNSLGIAFLLELVCEFLPAILGEAGGVASDMTNLSIKSATGYLFYFGKPYADVRQQCVKECRAGDKKPTSKRSY